MLTSNILFSELNAFAKDVESSTGGNPLETRAKNENNVSQYGPRINTLENNIEALVIKAEQTRKKEDIDNARKEVNGMEDSYRKDLFQKRLNIISPDIIFDRKNKKSDLNIYIKNDNMLSISLNTNIIKFGEYSGVESTNMPMVANITINSSLPYYLNAYMPVTHNSLVSQINLLEVKENSEEEYQEFENIDDKLVLKGICEEGNQKKHSIDLKLGSDESCKEDTCKTIIKFEAEQK